jgi:nucleoside-diphosphate-sugar epimerase
VTAESSSHRVILTGASGLLGQAIIKRLAERRDVVVLAFYRSNPAESESAHIKNAVVDLSDRAAVDEQLTAFKPTVFIHAAATGMQLPRVSTAELTETNAVMPARLAEAVGRAGGCSFVHISSGLAYKDQGRRLREEDPLDTRHPYAASKAEGEKSLRTVAEQCNLPLTIVRPFSFTGEGDFGTRFFPSLLRSAFEKSPFPMSAGDQVRDYSSVDDIAAGVIAAALATPETDALQVYNLGADDTRTLRELVTSVIDQLDVKMNVQFGARPLTGDEPMFLVPDSARARALLGWHARENVAHAVWRLARRSFPALVVNEPAQYL